jgi:hypothetical protein
MPGAGSFRPPAAPLGYQGEMRASGASSRRARKAGTSRSKGAADSGGAPRLCR